MVYKSFIFLTPRFKELTFYKTIVLFFIFTVIFMLKKVLPIIGLSFLSYVGNAQTDAKLNLTALTSKRVELSYELPAMPNIGIEPMIGLNFKKWGDGISVNGQDISVKRLGWYVGAKGNFYFGQHDDLTGFYLSPYVTFRSDKISTTEPARHSRLTTGLMLGQKGFFYERFGYVVEAGLGYNLIYNYKDIKTGETLTDMEDSLPILGSLTKIAIPFKVTLVYRISE